MRRRHGGRTFTVCFMEYRFGKWTAKRTASDAGRACTRNFVIQAEVKFRTGKPEANVRSVIAHNQPTSLLHIVIEQSFSHALLERNTEDGDDLLLVLQALSSRTSSRYVGDIRRPTGKRLHTLHSISPIRLSHSTGAGSSWDGSR